MNKARKALEEARAAAVEALRQARYFVKQADWLQERFPDAVLRDVEGLVKRVDRADIAAHDWSLTPGRYVGVAPRGGGRGFRLRGGAARDPHRPEGAERGSGGTGGADRQELRGVGGVSWHECTLGDVIKLQRGHDLPERGRVDGPVPIVSSSGITGRHNVAKADPPGVVTGRYGTIGEVFFVDKPYWPLNTALYVVDFKENDPRFTAYLLRNLLKNYKSEKAAVPGVDRNVLHLLKVRTTERRQQERVVSVLSAYDDLIENNRRRIALLEEAARMLYREWFVHFRFPGHEHVKIIDGLPEGLERLSASDAFEVNPKTSGDDEGIITYVPMAALSESGMVIDQTPLQERQASTSVRFRNGDTLFARITPCLENGKTGFVQFLADEEVACGSTEFIILREALSEENIRVPAAR